MAQFLLIHGSCHGAWCWRDVVPALRTRGHGATAIDLPGRGGDGIAPAEASLDLYAERVAEALAALPEPAVLVGHSAGGATITAAAERAPERVRLLVYLCAYALADGEALAAKRRSFARQPLLPAVRRAADGESFTIDRAMARQVFYHDCPDEAVDYALARLCPEPVRPQETPVRVTATSAALPRRYILCEADGAIPAEGQEEMVAGWPEGSVVRIASSHSPFFGQPERLAEILDGFAR